MLNSARDVLKVLGLFMSFTSNITNLIWGKLLAINSHFFLHLNIACLSALYNMQKRVDIGLTCSYKIPISFLILPHFSYTTFDYRLIFARCKLNYKPGSSGYFLKK